MVQGMELWRPDWPTIYKDTARQSLPDIDGELISVTRESLRLALSAIDAQNAQDYYHNYGAAAAELRRVLETKT